MSCIAVTFRHVRDRAGTPLAAIRGLGVADFEHRLDLLCERLRPIEWANLRSWLDRRTEIANDRFLLTFDDGLSDHAEVVAPILRRRGIRAVFFVQGEPLESGQMADHHLADILRCTLGDREFGQAVLAWLAERTPHQDWNVRIRPREAAEIYRGESPMRARFNYLLSHGLPLNVRGRMLNDLFTRHVGDPREWAARWYITRDDLKRLEADGHTIGGHGFWHEFYTRLDATDQTRDLARVFTLLRDHLGPGSRPFSYPHGSCGELTARTCAAAGFVHAFGGGPGWITRGTDVFQLPRVEAMDVERFLAAPVSGELRSSP